MCASPSSTHWTTRISSPLWFREPATWAAWRAFLAALFALKMSSEQFAIFKECTGRNAPQVKPATEAWLICGRRAGKSFILALCAVYLACFFDYRRHLAPGERGTVLIIATNSKQARVIVRYIRALLTHIPTLAKLIERETRDAFDLSNSVTIEVQSRQRQNHSRMCGRGGTARRDCLFPDRRQRQS